MRWHSINTKHFLCQNKFAMHCLLQFAPIIFSFCQAAICLHYRYHLASPHSVLPSILINSFHPSIWFAVQTCTIQANCQWQAFPPALCLISQHIQGLFFGFRSYASYIYIKIIYSFLNGIVWIYVVIIKEAHVNHGGVKDQEDHCDLLFILSFIFMLLFSFS